MQHHAAFHLGLYFLPKYPFREGLKILSQHKQTKYSVRFPKLYTFTVAFGRKASYYGNITEIYEHFFRDKISIKQISMNNKFKDTVSLF